MKRAPQIVCECGGELPRPMPHTCPHCGAVISSVRHSVVPFVRQFLVVTVAFAALFAFLAWLLSR